jgi:hypothetical protein
VFQPVFIISNLGGHPKSGQQFNLGRLRSSGEPLPGWFPTDSLGNWQNNPRGRRAKKLLEDAAAKPN